jgi:Protein of unknown function (DUF3551)
MRNGLTVLAVVGLAVLIRPTDAQAQNYPWCAQYADQGGTTNCGFVTIEQCRAALSGNGGYCIENPMFRPGIGNGPVRRPRR